MAEQRNIDYAKNRFAKAMVYLSAGIVLIYLMIGAVGLAVLANSSNTSTAVEILCAVLPFMLIADFGIRFIAQQTPAQIIKPYILMPLPKYACIDAFILSSIVNWGNMIWMAMILPYVLMAVLFGYGVVTSIMTIIFAVLLIMANSQWYAIVRTLINDNVAWWLLPVAVYAVAAIPVFIGAEPDIENLIDFYSAFGSAIDTHSLLPLIAAMALLATLIAVNRRIQRIYVRREITHGKTTHERIANVSRYRFLDRFGELGFFLQLEIKLALRNKNPRKAIIFDIIGVVAISSLIILTDIYDSDTMYNFWAMYNLVLFGSTIIARVMCYEGNYIDGLMVRQEKILVLLKAKYIFMSVLLTVPFTLMIPVVVFGKWPLYMLISYAVFTMGFQYFLLFQMAVVNKQTLPLNEKFTGKGGLEGNYIQMVVIAAIFIIPNALCAGAQMFLSDNAAYTLILVIGAVFVGTSNLWLRNIYNRMMKRRYENLEGFRSTR